jgi:hypothetical protein
MAMKFYALYRNGYNGGDPIEKFVALFRTMERAKADVETEIANNPLLPKYGEWITDGWEDSEGGGYSTICYKASESHDIDERQWTIREKYLIDD